jgi:hypothetical protein
LVSDIPARDRKIETFFYSVRLFEADMPAQVVVLQQPRGSYTLEVFKGFLAVGGAPKLHLK